MLAQNNAIQFITQPDVYEITSSKGSNNWSHANIC